MDKYVLLWFEVFITKYEYACLLFQSHNPFNCSHVFINILIVHHTGKFLVRKLIQTSKII